MQFQAIRIGLVTTGPGVRSAFRNLQYSCRISCWLNRSWSPRLGTGDFDRQFVLFVCAGMILNDVFDMSVDSVQRPHRPIPSGQISKNISGSRRCNFVVVGCRSGRVTGLAESRDDDHLGPLATGGSRDCLGRLRYPL